MCGGCHVVCLFGKKRKKARQIPKADFVIRMAYHMEGQRQPPSFTLLLYIKKASGSPGKEGVSLCQNFMFYITRFTVGLLLYSNDFTRFGSNL